MRVFFKRTSGLVLLAAVLLVGASATLAAVLPANPADISDEAKVLVKMDEEWSAAAGKRDIDKVASFYAEDAIAYPPNEPVSVGHEAAKKIWATLLSDESFSISWKATRAEMCKSGELGLTSGIYEASFKGPDGNMIHEKGKFLCVWKKQADGSWKAVHDMWNADAK